MFLDMILDQLSQETMPKIILRDIYLYAGVHHELKHATLLLFL